MHQAALAKSIMATKLITLPRTAGVMDALAMLLRHNITGAPVVEAHQQFGGVFSEKCCMTLMAEMLEDEAANTDRVRKLKASDIMVRRLVTIGPDMDVFDAIGYLLRNRISGAPVIGTTGEFMGVFSEKSSMGVVVETVYGQLPSAQVGNFMDKDRERLVAPDTEFEELARIFIETPYRRLPVVDGDSLLGQISRRDVLRAFHRHAVSHKRWDNRSVEEYLDATPATIDENTDLLAIAQRFRQTPYRRLPVLREGEVLGQVSRRDLLQAIHDSLSQETPPTADVLYLSSLTDTMPMRP